MSLLFGLITATATTTPYDLRLGLDLPVLGLGLAGTSIAFMVTRPRASSPATRRCPSQR